MYEENEFDKSRAMRAAWSTCLRSNVPKACQYFIFARQHANVPINVPTCQRRANFQIGVPTGQKACQFFNYFSKENIFQFLSFEITMIISGKSRNDIAFVKPCLKYRAYSIAYNNLLQMYTLLLKDKKLSLARFFFRCSLK